VEEKVLKLKLAQTKEYLNIDDVALLSNYSKSTIHRHISENKLKSLQRGKYHTLVFKRSDVQDWIEGINGTR
jgi:predicted DNA-binding transcriptional regulator AlpA